MAAGQGKRIPDEIRAAVLAELLAGHTVTHVSEKFKIPQGTVSRLRKAIPAEKLNEIETKKGERIAELITQNLELSFQAMNNIASQTANVEWLNRQNAHDLATLFGVTADKIFRVLEAIENARAASEADDDWPAEVR